MRRKRRPACARGSRRAAYAESIREMAESGGIRVPRLFGQPLMDKPILYYWILSASFRAGGWSELGARLPSALAALCTLALMPPEVPLRVAATLGDVLVATNAAEAL